MFFESYSLNVCVIVILIAALIFDYITKFFKYWYVRHVPCDTPIPCFGTDMRRVSGLRTTTEVVTKLYERHPNEKFVGYVKGRIPDLIVRDPEPIRSILATDCEHFARKGMCLERSRDVCLSNDLFYAEGEKRETLRDTMESFLKYSSWKLNWINNDMPTFNGEVCVQEEVSVFLDKLLTINFFTTEDSKNVGRRIISKLRTRLQKPSLLDRLKNYVLVMFPSLYVKFGFNFISKSIIDSLKEPLRKHIDNTVIRKLVVYKSFLKSSKSNSNNRQLEEAEQELAISFLCSFMNNGYIPSYNVIMATLYELANDMAIQERARNTVISQWNNILNFQTKEENYLDNVISEAMRMYPPYAVLGRVCTKTYKFPDCGTLIDKGVTVTIPVAAVHRDEKHYTNPETFDPSRFSSEVRQKRHTFSYIPFGGGPRKCVGENLSRWLIRVTVATLLRNHRFERSVKTPTQLTFVDNGHGRKLKDDLWLKMTPLNISTS